MGFPSLGILRTFIILSVLTVSCSKTSQTLHDLCKTKNKPIHTLEENESEVLIVNSVTNSKTHNLMYPRFKNRCHLEYKVCPSCHFEVLLKNMTIPCLPIECRCGFLEIEEVLPRQRLKYCGNHSGSVLRFESKTRHITLDFIQMEDSFHVILNITARRNLYTITGMPGVEYFIESPFFPTEYPPDYSAEYIFHSLDPKGHVRLLFLDFQILPKSYIEVFGHNAFRVETYSGNTFRPPAFTSHGIQMTLKFDANSMLASKAGFRAKCRFFRSDWNFFMETPYTDCSGEMETFGGIISVNPPSDVEQLVDCIWLLYPPFHKRNLFSATISEFENIGRGSFLEFRKGISSVSPVIKTFECHSSLCPDQIETPEITVSAAVGIYIRFRGRLRKESSLVFSYCTFSERECTNREFRCANGRCIHRSLHCDGYDHCTDNSDEEKCQAEIVSTTTSKSTRMITAVPPVGDKIPGGVTSLITLAALSGLVIVILVVVLIVRKFRKTRPVRRESHQAQHVVNVAGENPALSVCQNEENPPSYEDVLKYSGRFPRLSYASQTDAETNCSFRAFQSSSEETLYTSHDNLTASNDHVKNSLRNPTALHKSRSGSTPDIAHLSFVSNPHCVIHSSESPSRRSIQESRRLCRSLESRINRWCRQDSPHSCSSIHIIEHVVLQTLPYKHIRCMTLPPNYKLPQRERQSSNHGSSGNTQKTYSSSRVMGAETQLKECSCSLIGDILPTARNRGFSDSHRVTVVNVQSFCRKKASTF